MIRINLLPPAERQPAWPLRKLILLLALLVLFVLSSLYGYNLYTIWNLEHHIADVRNQYALLRPSEQQMLAANAKQQRINVKNNILITLTNDRRSWYPILAHLGTVTPPQVWLTEVTMTENNRAMLNLKGMAVNYPSIATFLQKIEQDDIFADPVLVNAEQSTAQPVTQFEITVKLKGL